MSGAGHHHTAILCGPRNQPVSQIKGTVWGCRGADGESHGGRQFESDSEIVSPSKKASFLEGLAT
jgi:hypothetical protein